MYGTPKRKLKRQISFSSSSKKARSATQVAPKGRNPIYRMSAPNYHTFVRSCSINQAITTSGFTPGVGVTSFTLFSIWFTTQDVFIYGNGTNYTTVTMPGISDLAGLFDEIKIDAIEMTMHVTNDAATFGNASASGVLVLATDYNDKSAPGTSGDVQQYADCKSIPLRSDYTHREIIRPKFLTYSLDAAGTSTASTPMRGFQRSNLQTEHYGKKGAMLLSPNSGVIVFTFRYKYICKTAK